jgi:hypothetical protein
VSDTPSTTRVAPSASPRADVSKTLLLFGSEWYDGYHLVNQATIDSAGEAQEAQAAPGYENFGELRRSDDLDMLSDYLRDYDVTLEEYAASIERATSMSAFVGSTEDRFAALISVDFSGDDGDNTPSDDDDFRSQAEVDSEVADENVFMHAISTAMADDVPADLIDEFGTQVSTVFVEYTITYVDEEHLEPLIVALEARGYTVVRDH